MKARHLVGMTLHFMNACWCLAIGIAASCVPTAGTTPIASPAAAVAEREPADASPATDQPRVDAQERVAPVEVSESEPAAIAEPPEPVEIEIEPDRVPAFAKVGFRPRSLGKHRATVVRAGVVYAPSSLRPLSEPADDVGVYLPVAVIDADASGQPRRPRVLCEGRTTRLGLAVDEADLLIAAKSNIFVAPRPKVKGQISGNKPGLRLAGGAGVGVLSEADGFIELEYQGSLLIGRGFVASDELDVVYTPGELADDGRRNGKLREDVRFLDAPNGNEIGRTERHGAANELHIYRLGRARHGHTLVRYHDHDSFIVGWIDTQAIEAYPAERFEGKGGGGGYGLGRGKGIAALRRGTLLVPTDAEEVVGVVTADHDAGCEAHCEGRNPWVWIAGCGTVVRLRAVPPS